MEDLNATTKIVDGADTLSEASGEVDGGGRGEFPELEAELAERYAVLGVLGRGGMGTVVRAYDQRLRREVALKRLHGAGLDARGRDRLVREAQTMAQLAHPNVVLVHDVELTKDGTVTLIMEYVAGSTLAQWVSERQPSWEQVVPVFVAAGAGLAAAHQAGIVHRDFKPANVLLTESLVPKVTDFGLAKELGEQRPALGPDADSAEVLLSMIAEEGGVSPKTPLTLAGIVLGTPRYMAPEQFRGGAVDSRCDQYAFCVALWEALLGQPPFLGDFREVYAAKGAGPPAWPRSPVPTRIAKAIVRGLSPDPADRWPDMEALLSELRVDTKRRRRMAITVGVIASAVAASFAGATVQDARKVAACEQEGEAIAEVWNEDRERSLRAAFSATGSSRADATADRVVPWLDTYAEQWREGVGANCGSRASDDPLVEAARACFAARRLDLDTLLSRLEGNDDPQLLPGAVSALASLEGLSSCADERWLEHQPPPEANDQREGFEERLAEVRVMYALGAYQQAKPLAQSLRRDADEGGLLDVSMRAQWTLGSIEEELGNYEAAVEAFEGSYFTALEAGDEDMAHMAALDLAFTEGVRLGRRREARRWLAHATHLLDGPRRPVERARHEHMAAVIHRDLGEFETSELLFSQALAHRRELLGEEHPLVATTYNGYGLLRLDQDDVEGADEYLRTALAIRERTLGEDHPDLVFSLRLIASLARRQHDLDEAETHLERSKTILEESFGANHPRLTATLSELLRLRLAQGRPEDARALAQQRLSIVDGDDHSTDADRANAWSQLAEVEYGLGNLDAAGTGFDNALNYWGHSPEHLVSSISDMVGLGDVRHAQDRLNEASELYLVALALREREFGAEHETLVPPLYSLGGIRMQQGRHEEGAVFLERAIAIRKKRNGPDHPFITYPVLRLAKLRGQQGRISDARDLYAKAQSIADAHELKWVAAQVESGLAALESDAR